MSMHSEGLFMHTLRTVACCTVDGNNTVNVWILTPHRFAANSRSRADSVAYLR